MVRDRRKLTTSCGIRIPACSTMKKNKLQMSGPILPCLGRKIVTSVQSNFVPAFLRAEWPNFFQKKMLQKNSGVVVVNGKTDASGNNFPKVMRGHFHDMFLIFDVDFFVGPLIVWNLRYVAKQCVCHDDVSELNPRNRHAHVLQRSATAAETQKHFNNEIGRSTKTTWTMNLCKLLT